MVISRIGTRRQRDLCAGLVGFATKRGLRLHAVADFLRQTADRLSQRGVRSGFKADQIDVLRRVGFGMADIDHDAARAGGGQQFVGGNAGNGALTGFIERVVVQVDGGID